MYILGINCFHGDSSACLIKDGVVICAAEEERFLRVKHWAGFPVESIRFCLEFSGIDVSHLSFVAINQDSRANLFRKFFYTLRNRPSLALLLDKLKNKAARRDIRGLLSGISGVPFEGNLVEVEHHTAHLASCYHVSPFQNAVVVSVDGFGDFSSAAWGVGRADKISVDGRVFFPHSLGIFYQALTQFIGFPNYGDEYKVMGLAPYGKPVYLPQMRQIVKLTRGGGFELDLDYFLHHKESVHMEWNNSAPSVGKLFSDELERLLGPARKSDDQLDQRHKDIASSVQAMYEEAFFYLLNSLHNRYQLDSVAVSGGCGMNSVANGKIRLRTPFKKVYVQAAAGDAGGAIGAATTVWHKFKGFSDRSSRDFHKHAFWGPEFSDEYVSNSLSLMKEKVDSEGCCVERVDHLPTLCARVAERIALGEVIGWFQGRMEWGPRALGNRSILGDPRRADMKDILNLKIKRRESFRPFAPSVLRASVAEWFEQDDDVPFMMQVYQIRAEKRSMIPAVTHVDGSGRLQTVYEDTNPRYHALISAFRDITGVPMVLNTSFNENEPVVCTPEQALDCFLRTKMDVLVMGNWLIRRL